ncbi:MAG: adenine deaminase [Chloroflexi bacterium]|nr:adenine deaminase [Chloroflexota bacterium]
MQSREIASNIRVALGQEKADIVLVHGNLVNVYTGEVLEDWSVAIRGRHIAFVGQDASHTIGDGTEVIDVRGKFLSPGFIEGHFHLDNTALEEYGLAAGAGGTTTIIAEALEMNNLLGYQGVLALLEAIKDQPIKFFITTPSPIVDPAAEDLPITYQEIMRLLEQPQIVGVGEIMWPGLLEANPDQLEVLAHSLRLGKTLEGHSSGAKSNKLVAYISAGISSCHEPITPQEVLDRLRLGIHVMLREGSIRRDLEVLSPLFKQGFDTRRLVLTTDSIRPDDAVAYGHMEYLVQKAINLGCQPVAAIQMASLNIAEHFRLDHIVGGIAPGKQADILVLPDLRTIRPELVISQGKPIARNGHPLVEVRRPAYPEGLMRSIHLAPDFRAADFDVAAPDGGSQLEVRVVNLVSDIITREARERLAVSHGAIQADRERDIIKIAVIPRHPGGGQATVGFLKGFGLKSGAVASSYSWMPRMPVICVGADEADMALAVNRVSELQGDYVCFDHGKLVAELPLPVGGVWSQLSIPETAERHKLVAGELHKRGCTREQPYLSLQTLPCTGMPYFRLVRDGQVLDVRARQVLPLVVPD